MFQFLLDIGLSCYIMRRVFVWITSRIITNNLTLLVKSKMELPYYFCGIKEFLLSTSIMNKCNKLIWGWNWINTTINNCKSFCSKILSLFLSFFLLSFCRFFFLEIYLGLPQVHFYKTPSCFTLPTSFFWTFYMQKKKKNTCIWCWFCRF